MKASELAINKRLWIYDDIVDMYFEYEVHSQNGETTTLRNMNNAKFYDEIDANDYVLSNIMMRDLYSKYNLFIRHIKMKSSMIFNEIKLAFSRLHNNKCASKRL